MREIERGVQALRNKVFIGSDFVVLAAQSPCQRGQGGGSGVDGKGEVSLECAIGDQGGTGKRVKDVEECITINSQYTLQRGS